MTIIRLRMLNDDSSSGVSEMTIDPSPSLFDAPIAALASALDGDDRTPLLPVRHPNQDLFICDVLDAIPKDDMASMEHPVFSLSTALLHTLTRFPRLGSCTVKVSCRSEEHTSELQSLMRISYAVFCLKKNKKQTK